MTTRATLLLAAAILGAVTGLAQQGDAPGCKDPALFPVRMPHYRISKCESQPFAAYDFKGEKGKKHHVEGELTFVQYTVDKRENEPSALEVVRNYENALRKIGATIKGVDTNWWVNGTVRVAGHDTWAEAQKGNGQIWLRIVKVKAMEQTIVADAAALSNDLKSSGHVVVHGIYFDTASADLKAESAKAVGEIAKLLAADPSLKVFVVGHTDTVGSVDANLKLSRDRAESVIQALTTQHGIAAARLKSFGNGPFAPVATNGTEDGRAANRRVELVRQ